MIPFLCRKDNVCEKNALLAHKRAGHTAVEKEEKEEQAPDTKLHIHSLKFTDIQKRSEDWEVGWCNPEQQW